MTRKRLLAAYTTLYLFLVAALILLPLPWGISAGVAACTIVAILMMIGTWIFGVREVKPAAEKHWTRKAFRLTNWAVLVIAVFMILASVVAARFDPSALSELDIGWQATGIACVVAGSLLAEFIVRRLSKTDFGLVGWFQYIRSRRHS